jgi:hypothetical protein
MGCPEIFRENKSCHRTFHDQVVQMEKGWVEQEFVLLIIAALPSEAGLPNELIPLKNVSYLS